MLLLFMWWTRYLYEWTLKYYRGVVGAYLHGTVPFLDYFFYTHFYLQWKPSSNLHTSRITYLTPPPWKMCLILNFRSYNTYKTSTFKYLRPGISIFFSFPICGRILKDVTVVNQLCHSTLHTLSQTLLQ